MRIQLLIAAVGPIFLACSLSSAADREAQSPGASDRRGQEPQSSASQQGAKPSAEPQALFSKGQTALQSGDLDGAEKAFRQVLAMDPSAGAAYSNLGVIAMRRKDWDQALRLLEKASTLAP